MLSTIAALYAVASSWLSPVVYSPDSTDGTSPTHERDRVARRSLANRKDFQGVGSSPRGDLSGATSEHSARPPNDHLEELRTNHVDSLRGSGETVLRDAATSPDEPGLLIPRDVYNADDDTGTNGVRHIGGCIVAVSNDADDDGHVSRGVRSRTSNVDTASAAVNARNLEKGMRDIATSTADIDHARDCSPSVQRSVEETKEGNEYRGLNVDRAMPPVCPPSLEKGNGVALPEGPYVAMKENIELRKRAERAEQELEETRQRLQRTLEGGAAGQANVDTAVNRAEECNGGVGHDETLSSPSLQRGRNYSRRRRSAHRSVPAAMGTKARISSRNAKNKRCRNVPEDSSSSDSIERQRRYSSDDNREGSLGRQAQSVQDYKSNEHDRHKSRRSRRRHSIAPESRSTGGGAKVDTREDPGKGKEEVDSHPRGRKERRGRVELRASDLRRMREVIARLKITTALLHAERAKRAHAHVGDEEGNSEALVQENAILRRKLYGLMRLEELEGRAMEKNLLPLTAGELSSGDLFPREALK